MNRLGRTQYFEIEHKGELKRVIAQVIDGVLWFKLTDQPQNNRTDSSTTYNIELKSRRSSKTHQLAPLGEVIAPMPGKILKLSVKKGQRVEKGQLMVVMEAMKMEYSFTADFNGTVEAVDCKEGDQVVLSQRLVKISEGKS